MFEKGKEERRFCHPIDKLKEEKNFVEWAIYGPFEIGSMLSDEIVYSIENNSTRGEEKKNY